MSPDNAAGEEYRYEKFSWPEHNDLVKADKTVVVPVACIEDHGRHLPIDVDVECVTTISEGAVKSRTDSLLFPTVKNGYDPHHMHMPGSISQNRESFLGKCIDIGTSLTHHGYERVLFVNGHGSNTHLLDQVQRQVNLHRPEARAAAVTWWELQEVVELMAEIGEGGPSGSSHAGESETSVYLHLHPDDVDMDEAVREIPYEDYPKHFARGWWAGDHEEASTRVTMMEYWSKFTDSGVSGDATVASAEKGEKIVEAAVTGLNSVLDEFAELPDLVPTDNHVVERTDRDFEPFRPG